MLNIVLWKWEQPGSNRVYNSEHVNVMCSMLRRNLPNTPHRIICVTDSDAGITECETVPLWPDFNDLPNASGKHLPSCYRRLKLYDPETQRDVLGINPGERIMGLDLDSLITGDLRELVRIDGLFVGWHLLNHAQRLVFNGSLQMFTAGTLSDIWKDFDPAKSPKEAAYANFRGSDQAWLSYKLCERPGCIGLQYPLVSSYPLQNRMLRELKAATRIVFFHGSMKPWDNAARFTSRWIDRYWRH